MNLPDLIAETRKQKRMSIRELARRADVDASTISRIESGETIPRGDTLSRIRVVLGIDPRTLDAAIREQEHGEEDEIQAINLRRVPPERRPLLRRQIDALVREAEENQ